jgi:hypothetical protein
MCLTNDDALLLIRTVQRVLSLWRQVLVAIVAGVAADALLWAMREQLAVVIDICPLSYVMVFLVTSFGVNSIYWLWSVPIFISRLLRIDHLNLWWHAPAHTPGIRCLSRLLGISALMAGTGVVLTELPVLFIADRLPIRGLLSVLYFGGLIGTICTFAFVAVYPQICLSRAGLREKRRILEEIGEEINAQRAYVQGQKPQATEKELEAQMRLYDRLVSAPAATVAPEAITRFLTGLFMALLPYILKALGLTKP